ncbi:hypothetical protein LTR64_008706 [Lithohypha guttulata]|uniref:uncharacterized protein n=1 Tax=Lithohypha guttulata TaxID=1690604 RepID=UPI002DDF4BA2|nr:hypothetical protein LTR51_008687 [Lithohypha guttulata]
MWTLWRASAGTTECLQLEQQNLCGHTQHQTSQGLPPSAAGLVLTLVLEEKLPNFAKALEALLSRIVKLEELRTVTRLWFPGSSLHKLPAWATNDEPLSRGNISTSTNAASNVTTNEKRGLKSRRKHKKTDESKAEPKVTTAASQLASIQAHEGRKRNKGGLALAGLSERVRSIEGLYALRIVILTIALGVPAVIPSSAGFFYREKGLWALIMAQTGTAPYTSDFVVGLILRCGATVLGGVIGMVAWYVGAGDGPGNPYGIAAIMAPILVVLMWLRLHLPPVATQAVLIGTATCYLVVSYSWVDTHSPSYGDPGVGYTVFWRRTLLVLVGFTASAILTLFPTPPSANRQHRLLLAEGLATSKNQYSLLTANCRTPLPDLRKVVERVAIDNAKMLQEAEPSIKMSRFAYSSSSFDAKSLALICRLCQTLDHSITQLLIYAPMLPEDLTARFISATSILNEKLVADVMAALSLMQLTLETRAPLPATMPFPLHLRSLESVQARYAGDMDAAVSLNRDLLAQEGARKYCSAMTAWVQFLRTIDELVMVAKAAVGETGLYTHSQVENMAV